MRRTDSVTRWRRRWIRRAFVASVDVSQFNHPPRIRPALSDVSELDGPSGLRRLRSILSHSLGRSAARRPAVGGLHALPLEVLGEPVGRDAVEPARRRPAGEPGFPHRIDAEALELPPIDRRGGPDVHQVVVGPIPPENGFLVGASRAIPGRHRCGLTGTTVRAERLSPEPQGDFTTTGPAGVGGPAASQIGGVMAREGAGAGE